MPQKQGPRVAAIVEEGNILGDIIEQAKEDAELVKGTQIENFSRSFRDIIEKIDQLKEWGVKF
jgi:hypothetical protein